MIGATHPPLGLQEDGRALGSVNRTNVREAEDFILIEHVLENEAYRNTGRYFFMRFDEFPGGAVPLRLNTLDSVTVNGFFKTVGSRELYVVSIHKSTAAEPQAIVSGVYSGKTATSPFEVLVILVDFKDGINACGLGATGRQKVQDLFWSGAYGYNIAQQWEEMSNGRRTIPFGSAGYRIAGPYVSNFTVSGTTCDGGYKDWIAFARSAAINEGFNLNNYATIAVVVPAVSCTWWGRGTLYTCSTGDASWLCMTIAVRCLDYVLSHELGHNHDMTHAAIDPEDDDSVLSSQTYLDW